MRVAVITGDRRRHLALSMALEERGLLAGAVVQKRESIPESIFVSGLREQQLVKLHFDLREQAEEFFFPGKYDSDEPVLRVSPETLNSDETLLFLRSLQADLVISWGCGLLSDEFLGTFEIPCWNLHAGLSPEYKGAATLFWPSYMLQPTWTGVTIHEIIGKIDAGPIVQQTVPSLRRDEGLQMLSARATLEGIVDLVRLIAKVRSRGFPQVHAQKKTGKLWLTNDWRPEHLVLIYDQFGDRVANLALSGEIASSSPEPIRPSWR